MSETARKELVLTPESLADWTKLRKVQLDAGSQNADAFSDEFAVETKDVRGNPRIDHKKVPLKNADGSLNKAGKALLEITAPVDRAESVIAEKMRHGEYKAAPAPDPPRVEALGPLLEERVAKARGLRRATFAEAGGRLLEVWGRRLYVNANGRFVRLVSYYGRIVEYGA